MKIGVVDVDTSHPQNWIPIERELGHEVIGLWDGGSVHPPEYVTQFADEHRIPRVYESLTELAAEVDCAIVHGCDWDTHIEKARPFIAAGKSVLVDKPQAGNLRDLRQLCDWAGTGARIAGGSSLMFCNEIKELLGRPVAERGEPHTVFCGCAVDEFNYGIHAYALASGLLGPGAVSVRHLGRKVQRRVQITWRDGRIAAVVVGEAAGWQPFYASVATDRCAVQFAPSTSDLYRALLESLLPYLAGDTAEPPVSVEASIEPELCALAAQRSWLEDDREVQLSELTDADAFAGAEFAAGYRRQKYPDADA